MATLHPDLLLLAAVAQAYGAGHSAEILYCLADYGTHFTPPMTVGDMQAGLSILRVDSYRLVAPGLQVPDLLQHALLSGRVVLGQVRGHPIRKVDYWIALTELKDESWNGIAVGLDWAQVGIAAHYGHTLTGFYLVCAQPLPGWGEDPSSA
jgi:hypothetical protein